MEDDITERLPTCFAQKKPLHLCRGVYGANHLLWETKEGLYNSSKKLIIMIMKHPKIRHAIHKVETIFRFFGPIVAGIVYLVILKAFLDNQTFSNLLITMGIEFFTPLSLEGAVPVGYYLGLNPLAIILALTFQNALAALFVIWNYHLLFHIPKIGKYFVKFKGKTEEYIEKHNIQKHASVFVLFLFFIVPFKGTGSLSMSYIGKLISVNDWKIMLVSIVGTVAVTSVILLSLMGLGIIF